MGNRSIVQPVALTFGVIYLLGGILGFFTVFGGSATLTSKSLFNLFPVNLVHNLVHVVIGVAGLAAASDVRNARTYCQVFAIVLLVLGLLGFLSPHPLGLVYLGGADIALHLVSGALLAYVGFGLPLAIRSRR